MKRYIHIRDMPSGPVPGFEEWSRQWFPDTAPKTMFDELLDGTASLGALRMELFFSLDGWLRPLSPDSTVHPYAWRSPAWGDGPVCAIALRSWLANVWRGATALGTD